MRGLVLTAYNNVLCLDNYAHIVYSHRLLSACANRAFSAAIAVRL